MPPRLPRLLRAGILVGLALALTEGVSPGQQPLPPLPPPGGVQPAQPIPNPADPPQPEVLARGPVHEAFATTAEAPAASPIVDKQPPPPVEELPPDEKPSGDNVQWIPGYWHWEDDAKRYIWISGFWRVSPPGRLWVPGSWHQVRGGWQWGQGFWQEPAPQQPQQAQQQPEIQYLPPPPASIETGPTTPAVTATSFYVPGSWVWRGRFLWRPGFWIEHRPNWVWVPAHYRWSPVGYVFVDGYWDYPLASRGVLYAPVYLPPEVYDQPAFVYTPAYVVSEPAMVGALFVRRGCGSYYFGDYFAPDYVTVGYTPWCGTVGGSGFAVGFGVGRGWGYDPLWSYYSMSYGQTPGWSAGVGVIYGGRYNGTVARPPVTLVQQNTVINKITSVTNVTNVTNNVTVVNKRVTVNNHNVTDVAMLAPAKLARDLHPNANIQPISAQVRKDEAAHANLTRGVGVQRAKLEAAAAAHTMAAKATDPPPTLKLDVPREIATRAQAAQVPASRITPPPLSTHNAPQPANRVVPNGDPGPSNRLSFSPRVDPNPVAGPRVSPKVEPLVRVEPKGPVVPKVEPYQPIKLEPRVSGNGVNGAPMGAAPNGAPPLRTHPMGLPMPSPHTYPPASQPPHPILPAGQPPHANLPTQASPPPANRPHAIPQMGQPPHATPPTGHGPHARPPMPPQPQATRPLHNPHATPPTHGKHAIRLVTQIAHNRGRNPGEMVAAATLYPAPHSKAGGQLGQSAVRDLQL